MKLKRLFWVTVMGITCFSILEARDVYIYNGVSNTPVQTVKNVTKIVFDADGITVAGADSERKVSLTAFDNITFYDRTKPDAIASVTSEGELIKIAGAQLTVICGESINSITLYNTAGQVLITNNPCAKVASVTLAGYPDGVYFVKVKTVGKEVVRKIIKK